MREIKFRAWNNHSKEMIEHPIPCEWILANDPGVILQQYTGLKDKNGVEIYEGDICEGESIWSNVSEEGLITFEQGCFWFGEQDITEYFYAKGKNGNQETHLEVIGNIHENPELL